MELGIDHWRNELSERELQAVEHAESYKAHFMKAGAPGHTHFELIADLAARLDRMQDQVRGIGRDTIIKKVHWSVTDQCWRDVETGVRVEL